MVASIPLKVPGSFPVGLSLLHSTSTAFSYPPMVNFRATPFPFFRNCSTLIGAWFPPQPTSMSLRKIFESIRVLSPLALFGTGRCFLFFPGVFPPSPPISFFSPELAKPHSPLNSPPPREDVSSLCMPRSVFSLSPFVVKYLQALFSPGRASFCT